MQRGGVVAEIIPMFRNGAEHSGRIGIGGRDSGLDRRKRRKALPERQHVPGGGPVQGDTGRQTLKIIDAGKRLAQLFPVFGMRNEPCNGILRFLNGRKLAPRVAQALLKQAATHRRLRGVDHMAQRAHAFTPVEAAEQLQIALRNVVDEEVLTEIQRLERRKMFGILHLRLF